MSARCVVLVLAAIAGSGCAGRTTVAAAAGYGGAYVPQRSGAGLTTSVRIVDEGGPITRWSMLGLTALAATRVKEDREFHHYDTRRVCSPSGGCSNQLVEVDEVTSTYYIPAETMQRLVEQYDLITNTNAAEVFFTEIEIASRTLGGDTSGFLYALMMRPKLVTLPGPFPVIAFGGGLKFGKLTFADRPASMVTGIPGGATLVSMPDQDQTFGMLGFPARVDLVASPRLGFHVQWDLNLLSLPIDDGPHDPSPLRVGGTLRLGRLRLGAEWVGRGVARDVSTLQLEVGFAL